jgi:hypothetical protein
MQKMKLGSNPVCPDNLQPSPVYTSLDVGHLICEIVEFLLDGHVFLERIFVALLQLGVLVLECLHLPFVVTSLDIGLAKPEFAMSQHRVLK